MLAQRLSMVSGVAQVNVFGAQKFAVRIDVDPTQLASRQIGIDQVAHAIAGANVEPADGHALRPGAQLRRAGERPADGRPTSTARSSSPTATAARCASSEVANVYDGVENRATPAGTTARRRSISPSQRQPGTNTVAGRRRDQGAAAGAAGAAARPRCSSTSAATARCRFASRSTTSSSRCS